MLWVSCCVGRSWSGWELETSNAVGDLWMLWSHVPALGLEEGSSGRTGLEGGGAENKPGHGRALCGPHWFIGIRRGFIPSPAATSNAEMECVGKLWCPGATSRIESRFWIRGCQVCSSGSAALEVFATSAQKLENKWAKSCASSMSPALGSVKWQVHARVWDARAGQEPPAAFSAARGPGIACEDGVSGWDTADAGPWDCGSSHGGLGVLGPSPVGSRRPGRFSEAEAAGERSSSAEGRKGLGVGLCENPRSGQPGKVARAEHSGEARLPASRECQPSAGASRAGLAGSHLLLPWEGVLGTRGEGRGLSWGFPGCQRWGQDRCRCPSLQGPPCSVGHLS